MKIKLLLFTAALLLGACAPREGFSRADEALLDKVERQTLNYFTVLAEPNTGMARERAKDSNGNIVTTGGTGFGIMAIIAGAERGWLSRMEATQRRGKIARNLEFLPRFHGAWAHWYDADTGEAFSFSEFDDGGDIVETAFLVQGLLAARQWTSDKLLREECDRLWKEVEWDWYTRGTDTLYWHKSEILLSALFFAPFDIAQCKIINVIIGFDHYGDRRVIPAYVKFPQFCGIKRTVLFVHDIYETSAHDSAYTLHGLNGL